MRKTKISIEYPYRVQDMRRVFDESKAGVNITFKMTIPEAEQFLYEFSELLRIIKDHIINAKEKAKQ